MSDTGTSPEAFELRRSILAPANAAAKALDVAQLARRLARLGPTPVDRARLVLATALLLAKSKVRRRGRRTVDLRIGAFGRSATCTVSDFSHLRSLDGLFFRGDYGIEPLREPQAILDLGSNIGLSILYFRLRFPGARIVGYEPDPGAFALLRRNVAGAPQVTVHHAAVGEHDGTATFWSVPGAVESSLEHTHAAQRPVTVPVTTLQSILAREALDRVDILKLVVEGSEFRALRSLPDLGRIGAITGEILLIPGDPDRSEAALRALLGDFEVELYLDKGDGFWQFHARRSAARAQPGAEGAAGEVPGPVAGAERGTD